MIPIRLGLYRIASKNKLKIGLAIFILLACLSQLAWIHLNAALPRGEDDASYIATSFYLYRLCVEFEIRQFIDQYTDSMRLHPPLLVLLTIPLQFIFGMKISSCLFLYTLFIALFCIYLFRLAKVLSEDEWVALLAVVITCLFPMVYGLWRQFFLDFGLLTIVVLWLFYLLQSNEFREKAITLGILLGIGLLTKETFPLFVIGPATFIFLRGLRSVRREEVGRFIRNVLLILTIGGLMASTWYVKNFKQALADYLSVILEETPQSMGPVLSLSTLRAYWVEHINFGISFYFFALLVVLTAWVVLSRRRILTPTGRWILLTWFVIPITAASFSSIKDIRYMISVYPVIGIVLSALLVRALPQRKLARAGLLLLLVIFPLYLFFYNSFDSPLTPRRNVRFGSFILFLKGIDQESMWSLYAFPAQPTAWPVARIWKTFASLGNGTDDYKVAIVYDHIYFLTSLNLSSFFMSLPSNLSLVSLCCPANVDAAYRAEFLAVKRAGRFKDLAVSGEPEALAEIEKKLREKKLPFVEMMRMPLPADQSELIIYKRSLDALNRRPYDFFANLANATVTPDTKGLVEETIFTIAQDSRRVIRQRPDSKLTFSNIILFGHARLKFTIGIDESAWREEGEGAIFEVHVERDQTEYLLFAKHINPKRNYEDRKWHGETVDLGPFADGAVDISFVTKSGPNSGNIGDLAGWSDLKLEYESPPTVQINN